MHKQFAHPTANRNCAPQVRRCTSTGAHRSVRCFAGSNGTKALCPTPAETARTVVHLTNEGTLSAMTPAGLPIGIPVSYTLDERGQPIVQIGQYSAQLGQFQENAACSLHVQPISFPARALASVSLCGTISQTGEAQTFKLNIDKCLYFGGLDSSAEVQQVAGEDFSKAEPDVLRRAAPDFVQSWNSERAEDIYRIVATVLGVPVAEMQYAELLWVDRLGMYVRAEAVGVPATVMRVPFYRPVLDERDARSVITMAAQLAWERERNYVPVLPSSLAETAANN